MELREKGWLHSITVQFTPGLCHSQGMLVDTPPYMNENAARIHNTFRAIFSEEQKWTACLFVVMPHPRDFEIEMQKLKNACDAEKIRSPYDLWFTKSNMHKTTIIREQYEVAHHVAQTALI
jgi:hypothetical protein